MSLPSNSDLYLYAGRLFNQNDWDSNFKKIVTFNSAGTYDAKFNGLTLLGNASIAGSVTAASFKGDGSGLTNLTGTPIGLVSQYVGLTDPTEYMICDGRELTKSGYLPLWNVIGDRYR